MQTEEIEIVYPPLWFSYETVIQEYGENVYLNCKALITPSKPIHVHRSQDTIDGPRGRECIVVPTRAIVPGTQFDRITEGYGGTMAGNIRQFDAYHALGREVVQDHGTSYKEGRKLNSRDKYMKSC